MKIRFWGKKVLLHFLHICTYSKGWCDWCVPTRTIVVCFENLLQFKITKVKCNGKTFSYFKTSPLQSLFDFFFLLSCSLFWWDFLPTKSLCFSLLWRPVLKFLRSFVYAIQIPETFLEQKHIAFAQSLTWLKNSATFFEKVPPKKGK